MFRRFWEETATYSDAIAFIDGPSGQRWNYSQLAHAIEILADRLHSGQKKLVFLEIENDAEAIICYLALLKAGHAVFLCGDQLGENLVAQYQPDMIFLKKTIPDRFKGYYQIEGYYGHIVMVSNSNFQPPAEELCLLLSTSGTTNVSKLVRLSYENIAAAAEQVQVSLEIDTRDRAITNIPLDHVYGLSVLHGQLTAGGSLVLTKNTIMDKLFWQQFRREEVTSLAGVPWTYQTMRSLSITSGDIPSLRKITQSGAKLDSETRSWLFQTFRVSNVRYYFMYGQTEASGRICVLPPGMALDKLGSVGQVVQHGTIECLADNQIVYRGPNVMLGYALSREDLTRGSDTDGTLPTGDLGWIDQDNCLYINGRLSRIGKILGRRINLDDIQEYFPSTFAVAAMCDDNVLTLVFEGEWSELLSSHVSMLALDLRIPRQSIELQSVNILPRGANGKTNYHILATGLRHAEEK